MVLVLITVFDFLAFNFGFSRSSFAWKRVTVYLNKAFSFSPEAELLFCVDTLLSGVDQNTQTTGSRTTSSCNLITPFSLLIVRFRTLENGAFQYVERRRKRALHLL